MEYAERDIIQLDREGGHYSRHVQAMTAEVLHEKDDIAAELAWRDLRITTLEAELADANEGLTAAYMRGVADQRDETREAEAELDDVRQLLGYPSTPEVKLAADNARLREASPEDIRALGWVVAVHNDYRLNGVPHTFWLFTKDGREVHGEGLTDAAALNCVRAALAQDTGEGR